MILPRRLSRKPFTEGAFASVLDLGTSCIKAAVCEMRSGQTAVLGVGREPLGERSPFGSGGTFPLPPELLASLCDVALRRAEDMTKVVAGEKTVPDHLVIGVPGDLVCCFSTTVQVRRPRPESRITEDELTALLQRASRLSAKQLQEHPKVKEQEGTRGWALTNATVSEVQVDGVRVMDPLRFQGTAVRLTVVNVFAPVEHQEALSALAQDLDLQLMRLVAEPFALATSLPVGDGIFLDVGGDRTDAAMVRQGAVTGIASLPLGSRSLTRRLASRLGIAFDRAEELKLKRSQADPQAQPPAELLQQLPLIGALPAAPAPAGKGPSSSAAAQAEEAAEETRDLVADWAAGVAPILASLAEQEPLPSRIVLAGGGSQLPELIATLSSPSWVRGLPFAGIPNVGPLPPREVRGAQDRTQRLLGPQDVPLLALARLAAAADRPETLQDRLLQKVIGGHAAPFRR